MCGRIVWRFDAALEQWVKDWVDDEEKFEAAVAEPSVGQSRYNITPGSRIPIAMLASAAGLEDGAPDSDAPVIRTAKWAFPFDEGKRYIFNTRIETAFESPMWKGPMMQSRCVVPVTGFYEWKSAGKTRQPFYVHRVDRAPMLLAGVSGWRSHRNEPTRCASVVTCPPDGVMAKLHDRMPVILEASEAKAWLDPAATPTDLRRMARPNGSNLAAYPVATTVNSQASEGEDLLRPLPTLGDPLA